MGCFFLYNRTKGSSNPEAALQILKKKGFSQIRHFEIGEYSLLLCQKQACEAVNYLRLPNGQALYAVGTPYIDGLNYVETLRRVLSQYSGSASSDALDEVHGPYVMILQSNDSLEILTDRSGLYSVFSTQDGQTVSSSFLSLAASLEKLTVNRLALLEQLLVGYISGEDTLFHEIRCLNAVTLSLRSQKKVQIHHRGNPTGDLDLFASKSVALTHAKGVLREHYLGLSRIATELGTIVGLSGGYDSRLNVVLCRQVGIQPLAFTYDSAEHHLEAKIAERIASKLSMPLVRVRLRTVQDKSPEEIHMDLDDALFFYDGRANRTMGNYDDVCTRRLRAKVYGNGLLELNGLGGEIFRNRERYWGNRRFHSWLKSFILGPESASSLRPSSQTRAFYHYLRWKYEKLASCGSLERVTTNAARTFYRNVWLPYAAGVKVSAENQLAFFTLPFADHRVTEVALRASPYVGYGGEFESGLLRELDHEVATLQSTYGHPLSEPDRGTGIRSAFVNLVPLEIRAKLHKARVRFSSSSDAFRGRVLECPACKRAIRTLEDFDLPINFRSFLRNKSNLARAVYVGHVLNFLRNRIDNAA